MAALSDALKEAEYFLLDMDGTLYVGDEPIGDMAATLAALRNKGKKLVYLTNNSSRSVEDYRAKLVRIGLWGEGDEVYTSGVATAETVCERFAGKRVYLVGTESLQKEFLAHGIALTEEDPDIVVLAYDTGLNYDKLCKLTYFLRKGAYYVATHPDLNCPAPKASVPDVGSFIALVEASTGRRPDEIVGKPFPGMGDRLVRRLCGRDGDDVRKKFIMTGDRMNTDIRFGNACGFRTLLVLSGETTRENVKNYPDRPDFILGNFNEVLQSL